MRKTIKAVILLKITIPLILLTCAFILPVYHLSFDVSLMLTITSILFTILVGFFIAAATTNHFRLQVLFSEETGNLVSIYNLTKLAQPQVADKIANAIDQYLISCLDDELDKYILTGEGEFNKMMTAIDGLDYQNFKNDNLVTNISGNKSDLYRIRHEIFIASQQVIGLSHWVILALLVALINIFSFSLRDGGMLTSFLIGALSVANYFTFILVYEIDKNWFMEQNLSFGGIQQTFRGIGKLDYYPDYVIENKRIKNLPGTYRIGVFKNYLASKEKEIKVINS